MKDSPKWNCPFSWKHMVVKDTVTTVMVWHTPLIQNIAPAVQISTHWKGQIRPKYYYNNSFDLMEFMERISGILRGLQTILTYFQMVLLNYREKRGRKKKIDHLDFVTIDFHLEFCNSMQSCIVEALAWAN